ncbi:unnamed protein product [marine sediment metagenome]|uniref:Uncharacterized protein n=1 Tax=marine sediment metagenome TaxID=412755 RepID=X1PZH8_9ZZZZ
MNGLLDKLHQQQAAPVQALGIPKVFERAFGIAALLNPRATIDEVVPTSIKVGDRIDLAVFYTPRNDEESRWQTMVVVKEGATVLVQERQKHESMSPGRTRADCDTRLTMPDEPVTLDIEVWGHPDWWTGTTPY